MNTQEIQFISPIICKFTVKKTWTNLELERENKGFIDRRESILKKAKANTKKMCGKEVWG